MIVCQVTTILEVDCAQYAISHAFHVQVHHPLNAFLAQILSQLEDQFKHLNVSALTNILMTLNLNSANLVHQPATLAKAIKTHALNAWWVKIESWKEKNVFACPSTTNLEVPHALNAIIYAKIVYLLAQIALNVIHNFLEHWNRANVTVILVIMMMAHWFANVIYVKFILECHYSCQTCINNEQNCTSCDNKNFRYLN